MYFWFWLASVFDIILDDLSFLNDHIRESFANNVRFDETTFSDDRLGGIRWFTGTGFIYRPYPKFVLCAFLQAIDSRLTDIALDLFAFYPFFAEFLLVFNYVSGDRCTTVILGLRPRQVSMILVPVGYINIRGFAWLIWKSAITTSSHFISTEILMLLK